MRGDVATETRLNDLEAKLSDLETMIIGEVVTLRRMINRSMSPSPSPPLWPPPTRSALGDDTLPPPPPVRRSPKRKSRRRRRSR